MSEEPLSPALLGRVLAEAKSIQALSHDGTVVWFEGRAVADACGLPVDTVTQTLGCLGRRGEVVRAITLVDGSRVTMTYALAEAVEAAENNATRPEAG